MKLAQTVVAGVLFLIIGAGSAHASVWDILQGDIDAWGEAHDAEEEAILLEEEDIPRENAEELFPVHQAPVEKTKVEEQRDERIAGFVSAEVEGKLLVSRDVPRQEWFAPYVRAIAEEGIVSGYKDADGNPTGEFRPGGNVTIEELAKIAVQIAVLDTARCPLPARNLTASGSWSGSFIACAEQEGWAVYSDGAVDVKRPATRAEVVMTVLQSAGAAMLTASGSIFQDVQSSTLFAGAIARAKADSIVSGYADAEGNTTGVFGPDDPVTRAELAKIVSLALQKYARP